MTLFIRNFSYVLTGIFITLLFQYQVYAENDDRQKSPVVITYVDPLQKVLRTDTDFGNASPVMDVARGEHASLQFVVRSTSPIKNLKASITGLVNGNAQLKKGTVRYVGYVRVTSFAKDPAKDRIRSKDSFYPDPLLEQSQIDVSPNSSQPVWITVPIPIDAVPGTYNGQLTFEGQTSAGPFNEKRSFQIKVYPVQIRATSLNVSIWPSIEIPKLGNIKNKLAQLNGGQLTPFNDRYWALVKNMADMMHDYCQNVIMIFPIHLVDYTITNGKYGFDFSKFDRMVQIFKDAGVIGRMEGGFLGGLGGNGKWGNNFELFYYVKQGDRIVLKAGDLNNKDLVNYYQQFIPAFVKHLKEKNWYKNYYQHIADEPTDGNSGSYIALSSFIKKLAPDLKTIEAIQTTKVANQVDVIAPELEYLAKDYNFYKNQMKKGQEVWFYTCWLPQGEFANRFIEQPLIKTRLLHWINYKYGATGYLHWSYNGWTNAPFGEASIISNSQTLPAGDAWIVYPKSGGLLSSLRLEGMRDGIIDYELLKMLARQNSQLALSIAGRIVRSFTSYETNINTFRTARKELLQALGR